MIRDSIVDEVRKARLQTEEACGHDWKRLAEHYRSVELGTARLIRLEPRKLTHDLLAQPAPQPDATQ